MYSTSFMVSSWDIPTKTHSPRPIELINSSFTGKDGKQRVERQIERGKIREEGSWGHSPVTFAVVTLWITAFILIFDFFNRRESRFVYYICCGSVSLTVNKTLDRDDWICTKNWNFIVTQSYCTSQTLIAFLEDISVQDSRINHHRIIE